ncbi:hypothetical protein CEXT_714131 [Caerostris extrusa]|uniref:Uncharacterized protein n=1 Tax=Caerostris extrusa TaxID=172846 RepID=A0AAV4N362_CAEEX|nr:hypothetical protein CEXT_714131 [Caerostris extrusa]
MANTQRQPNSKRNRDVPERDRDSSKPPSHSYYYSPTTPPPSSRIRQPTRSRKKQDRQPQGEMNLDNQLGQGKKPGHLLGQEKKLDNRQEQEEKPDHQLEQEKKPDHQPEQENKPDHQPEQGKKLDHRLEQEEKPDLQPEQEKKPDHQLEREHDNQAEMKDIMTDQDLLKELTFETQLKKFLILEEHPFHQMREELI